MKGELSCSFQVQSGEGRGGHSTRGGTGAQGRMRAQPALPFFVWKRRSWGGGSGGGGGAAEEDGGLRQPHVRRAADPLCQWAASELTPGHPAKVAQLRASGVWKQNCKAPQPSTGSTGGPEKTPLFKARRPPKSTRSQKTPRAPPALTWGSLRGLLKLKSQIKSLSGADTPVLTPGLWTVGATGPVRLPVSPSKHPMLQRARQQHASAAGSGSSPGQAGAAPQSWVPRHLQHPKPVPPVPAPAGPAAAPRSRGGSHRLGHRPRSH